MTSQTPHLADRSLPLQHHVETGKHWFLARVLVGRFLVLGGVLLAVSSVQPVHIPGFTLFMAISLVTLVPYSLWVQRHPWRVKAVSLQFVFDVIVATGLVHFSGGLASPFFALYPLTILATGLVERGSMVLKITLLSALFYLFIILLEGQHVLVYHGEDSKVYANAADVGITAMARVFLFVFFGAASTYLAMFTAYQSRQIRCYASLVESILDHIPVGIFAVTENGTVAMANRAAYALVHASPKRLPGSAFNSIFANGKLPDHRADGLARASLTGGPGDDPVPVICASSQTTVPDGFFRQPNDHRHFFHAKAEERNSHVTIWAVRDIRAELEAERASQEATRLQTTAHVAAELAHHVRNSLTAITSAAQLMRMTIADNDVYRPIPDDDRNCVVDMSELIDKETSQLEAKLSDVLRQTEEDPLTFSDEAAALYAKYLSTGPRHGDGAR
ncbi:MAG: PAS domain-containing protein [Candidatus Pacebacteria bacterium]|nr:PAS domain-containing protein [Candidatus Paceibacterota bacterium]